MAIKELSQHETATISGGTLALFGNLFSGLLGGFGNFNPSNLFNFGFGGYHFGCNHHAPTPCQPSPCAPAPTPRQTGACHPPSHNHG
jgi:hypothetical protein